MRANDSNDPARRMLRIMDGPILDGPIMDGGDEAGRITPQEWRLAADDDELAFRRKGFGGADEDDDLVSDYGFDYGGRDHDGSGHGGRDQSGSGNGSDQGGGSGRAGPRFAVSHRVAIAAGVLALLGLVVCAWLALRPAIHEQEIPRRDSPVTVIAPGATPSTASGGLAVAAAADSADSAYSAYSADSANSADSADSVSVYVVGQVRDPGVVKLPAGARVVDAIEAAGGATRRADLTAVNLARHIADGEQIVVPKPGEVVVLQPAPVSAPGTGSGSGSGSSSGSGPGGSGSGAPAQPVNLNTATEAQFDALPGVGPVIAGRIVAWRQQNGQFASVDQLGEVDGIGDATLAKLKPFVTV